jgi:hypothetical protein
VLLGHQLAPKASSTQLLLTADSLLTAPLGFTKEVLSKTSATGGF